MSDVLTGPEIVLFAGDSPLAVGQSEQHGLKEFAGSVFGRSRETVQAEWNQVVDQARSFVAAAAAEAGDYALDEVTFELGFSAEGRVAFIAKGGVDATISMTFKRRTPASGGASAV